MQYKKEYKMEFKKFLEGTSPYKNEEVDDFCLTNGFQSWNNYPDIEIFCNECEGLRFFEKIGYSNTINTSDENTHCEIIKYVCKNCNKYFKLYTIEYKDTYINDKYITSIRKNGEYPPFGSKIPPKMNSLAGPERDIFLKGKRCEDQSLGIGAYAYYRRIVENEKDRLINEIIKVCERLGNNDELIKELENAKTETQFSKAIDSIKHELPSSLFIEGQNPLKLLHSAISKGVHNMSDDECLQYAQSVRVILFELIDKMNAILKDTQEIHDAISILNKLNSTS